MWKEKSKRVSVCSYIPVMLTCVPVHFYVRVGVFTPALLSAAGMFSLFRKSERRPKRGTDAVKETGRGRKTNSS